MDTTIIIIIIIILPPIPTHWFFKCLLSIPLGCSHLWCALFFQPATTWRFPLRSPDLQVLGDTTAIGFCQPNAALAIPLLAGQNLPGLEKMRGLKFNPPRLNLITMNLTILCPLFPDFCHNDRTGRNKSAGSCCHKVASFRCSLPPAKRKFIRHSWACSKDIGLSRNKVPNCQCVVLLVYFWLSREIETFNPQRLFHARHPTVTLGCLLAGGNCTLKGGGFQSKLRQLLQWS